MKIHNFYGENGEDFLLWSLFENEQNGFCIDVGAHDGIHSSNSYIFEKIGWAVICTEANQQNFKLCTKNRPKSICIHSACVESRSSAIVKQDSGTPGSQTTLNEIASKHAPADKKINFISLNIAGKEFDILKDFYFQQWNVIVFIIKVHDEKQAQLVVQTMQRYGYGLCRVLQGSYFFSRHEETHTFLRYKRISCRISNAVNLKNKSKYPARERERRIEGKERWITPNVLCQQRHQPLWSLLEYFPPTNGKKNIRQYGIVHVVNPYPVEADNLSGRYQQLTYQSMSSARDFGKNKVTLVSVQHKDDEDLTPPGFVRARDLDRDVRDIANFTKPQPLPLLFDILDRGAEYASKDDYIVYTNSDIILMPFFYETIRELIGYGFDAMNICRRTIGEHALYGESENLARSEVGSTHPGSDCFVFSRKMYDQFIRNDCCIGKPAMPRNLLCNMAANAQQMLILRNVNLTYHIGDDRSWISESAQEYESFIEKEYRRTVQRLRADPKKRGLVEAFINTYWQNINLYG